jgi:hypothetical protein
VQEKKDPKGFCCIRSACSIWTLKSRFHSILVSVLVCEIKGSRSFEWGGWTCALEMRQNNVEKHSKNACTILEATGKSTTIEDYCQLRNCINKKYEEFCLLTAWTICFYFAVCGSCIQKFVVLSDLFLLMQKVPPSSSSKSTTYYACEIYQLLENDFWCWKKWGANSTSQAGSIAVTFRM